LKAYIAFYKGVKPFCYIANTKAEENPMVKDVEGLIGDRPFVDYYLTFMIEYGLFPYYGKVGKNIYIFLPKRKEDERNKIFKDFLAVKKIILKHKVKKLYVTTVYPIDFFYQNAGIFPIIEINFLSYVKGNFKIISQMTVNPFLCKGGVRGH